MRVSTFNKSTNLIKKRLQTIQNKVEEINKGSNFDEKVCKQLKVYESETNEKFKEFNQNLSRLVDSETDEFDEETIFKIQDSISELHNVIISQILIPVLDNSCDQTNVLSTVTSNEIHANRSSVRLPKINLPEFNGDIQTWLSFYNLFNATIHTNSNLTSVEKFQYLLSSLKGEALNIIKSLPISDANYNIAYELLKTRYQNTRRLVNYHVNNIIDLDSVSDSSNSLRHFLSSFTENQQALAALNHDINENNVLLLNILTRKLDSRLRKKFEDSRKDSQDIPLVTELLSFLEAECRHFEDANVTNIQSKSCVISNPTLNTTSNQAKVSSTQVMWKPKHKSTLVSIDSNNIKTKSSKCVFCNVNTHHIYQCKLFSSLNAKERHSFIKEKGYCFNCLSDDHKSQKCLSTKSCMKCGKKHHTYLHLDLSQNSCNENRNHIYSSNQSDSISPSLANKLENKRQTNFVALAAKTQTSILLATTLANLSTSDGRQFQARGILDSAAQSSYITQRLASLMGVKRNYSSNVIINGISNAQVKTKGITNLTISSIKDKVLAYSHPFTILQNITSFLPSCRISKKVKTKCQSLTLADPSFDEPGTIDFLIGADLYGHLFTGKRVNFGSNMPIAFETLFGFVLLGEAPVEISKNQNCTSTNLQTFLTTNSENLHKLVKTFWEIENIPENSKLTQDEINIENHFVNTHYRDETGRFVVKLPFKQDPQCLGDSKSLAEIQYLALERKMKRNQNFKNSYINAFNDYLSCNHIVKTEQNEKIPQRNCYLPHHGVIRESASTPLRIVFNGSSKTSNNLSLNSCMHPGPKLQSNISDVIIRFKFHNIVFSCDIKQMYRQIIVDDKDQYMQLLVWRESPDQPIQTYKLTRVVFGLTSSPYLALRCLKQLSIDEGHNYPKAANLLNENTFVDDITGGVSTVEECLKLQEDLTSLLSKGGFELRKWTSNSPEFLKALKESNFDVSDVSFSQTDQKSHSILGLKWDSISDTFHYKVKTINLSETKRSILSIASSLWDPCGWLTPITFYAKCFIQMLWTLGLSWDEKVPQEVFKKWKTFVDDIPNLKNIKFNRCCKINNDSNVELHGFGDASESGYAGVVYSRTVSSDGEVTVSLLIAKSKVAPLKRLSLPRLELCAAHMVAKLLKYCQDIISNHCKELKVFAWSDSTIALSWIKTPPYRLKVFVANRVADIQELIPTNCWLHVSSENNPADCGSRGLLPSELTKHKLWLNGPLWLKQPHELRPLSTFDYLSHTELPETKPPLLENLVVITNNTHFIDVCVSRCSSWIKLVRVFAYIQRFVNRCKKVVFCESKELSVEELDKSVQTICKLLQELYFSNDIKAIRQNKECSVKLQRLHPFIDSNRILRVGGRLKFADIPSEQKNQIILPKSHKVIDLLIDYYHIKNLHAGSQLCNAVLREKFWILSSRSIVRSRIFKCIRCFKVKPKITAPLMGDLPATRLTPERPFTNTGVDYAGPFKVKLHTLKRLQHIKVYLCLFICFSTKAVHIEVVTDLTSDAYIAALNRFISRRGIVKNLYSDCGTNFVGAAAKLKKTFKSFLLQTNTKSAVLSFADSIQMKFHFLPPAAPHMGGLWESAVKSAKYHLIRVLGTYVPTLEEFVTLSTKTEAMLNSRPLTQLSNDPSDLTPLTPGHFLIGSSLIALPEESFDTVKLNRLTRWQTIQAFTQRLWKRWHKEYLNTLQQRMKWSKPTPNLKIGDLVIIHNHDSPPLSWPLGRIIEAIQGSDKIVRVVKLKTTSGDLLRPALKVSKLPIDD